MALATQGPHVVVSNRSDDAGRAVVEEITDSGGSAISHCVSVGHTSDAEALVELALQTWGRLDIVVDDAGESVAGTILHATDDGFDDTLRVHIRGTFNTTRAAARHTGAYRSCSQSLHVLLLHHLENALIGK